MDSLFGGHNSIDLLIGFLKESKPASTTTKKFETEHQLKLVTLADEKVMKEDEEQFQEYFLNEKIKIVDKVYRNPVSQDFEVTVNSELVEQSQEMIIEHEESVPAYHTYPNEEYAKVGPIRRSKMGFTVIGILVLAKQP